MLAFLLFISPYPLLPQGDDPAGFAIVAMYKASTLSRAHGVLRKNFSDDLIDGSFLKQLMLMRRASSSQP